MKVILWILGIIGAIVVVIVVAGYFIGTSMKGDVDAAAKFAATATKEECVDEMSKRLNACDGISCMMSKSVFGSVCLSHAKGDRAEVCRGVPDMKDRAAVDSWSTGFCAQHSLKKDACPLGVSMVTTYCGSGK